MGLTRRDFMRHSCCTAAVFGAATSLSRLGLIHALAQSAPDFRALVCIFLFGGNDSNNLIVPTDSAGYQNYFNIRNGAGLALAQTGPTPLLSIASIKPQNGNTAFGLHPAIPELQALYNSGKLAFLANVGSLSQPVTQRPYKPANQPVPSNLFSHSDQQQQWQSLQMNGIYRNGWAGRMADKIQPIFNSASAFPPITSVAGSAIFNTGLQTTPYAIIPNSTPALSGLDGSASANARLQALQQLLTFDTGVSLIQSASSITSNSLTESSILSNALKSAPALTTPFPVPATSIGNQLKQVAQILSVRSALGLNRQIFFCSLGGFDTHSGQIAIQNTLLTQLSQALNDFYNATVELNLAQQVTTFTMSDFSRTFQPGSNGGTDHAWGSVQMIAGGALKAADIYGTLPVPTLGGPDDAGSNGRWIPTTSIDQYGATLATWFGVQPADLTAIFPNLPNFATKNLGLLV